MKRIIKSQYQPWQIAVLVIAAFLSACLMGFGMSYAFTDRPSIRLLHLIPIILGLTVLLVVAYAAAVRALSWAAHRSWPRLDRITPSMEPRSVLVFTAILLVCWLPYLIAFYPGPMGWDTYYMIYQCAPDHGPLLAVPAYSTESWIDVRFTDHHPLFDTLIIGTMAQTSEALTGS